MLVLLVFAFISGLVTIFAPCIWPLLPIILSSSATGGKNKALGMTIGIGASFALFTLTISYLVKILPIDAESFRLVAVIVIGFLGLSLIIPSLNQKLESWVSTLSGKMNISNVKGDSFLSGFITGASLGIVWTPCAGPILATIATLAATRSLSIDVVLVTLTYVVGVCIPLFLFTVLGNKLFTKTKFFSQYTGRIQQIFGVIMIITAVFIYTGYDKTLQANLLDAFPSYSQYLTALESNPQVQDQLDKLSQPGTSILPKKQVPEFVGITQWLNIDTPPTMASLRGKVVLVDFWTYTCINCIRTLPYVTSWYEKYKDDGFVVIGVHAPEFEFEKKTENVENAIQDYGIAYPVAQDNNFATWRAYNNHYWPAKYLIDVEGSIRYTHFGEGKYEETEMMIKQLLEEKGTAVTKETVDLQDQTPQFDQTPETYLGLGRINRVMNGINKVGKQNLTLVPSLKEDYFSYGGTWNLEQEYAESIEDAVLVLSFRANNVYLVMHPAESGDNMVRVYLDGKQIDTARAGKDVQNGVVKLDVDRLYELVDLQGDRGNHELRLEFDPGIQIFAFTFG
ncbi:cytochrome c biogenesis protein DipZ [Candidatus Woesebacteria bacterium]|nr:cytochrome c biogenesis protein DipZ [Candidatus Woesebacteria bacterium]